MIRNGSVPESQRGGLTRHGQKSCSTWHAPKDTELDEDCQWGVSFTTCPGCLDSATIWIQTGEGCHLPLFGRRHGINVAAVEMPVPGNGAHSEGGRTGGESVVLEGVLGGGGRGRGSALHHPIRQPSYQLQQKTVWASDECHRGLRRSSRKAVG